MEQEPRRSGPSPWLIGCGALLLLVVLGGGGGIYLWYRSAVIDDPAKVVEHAAKILPGAAPQPGMVGVWGMDTFGLRMAVLGPPKSPEQEQDVYATARKGMAIMLVGLPDDPDAKVQRDIQTAPKDAKYTKLGEETHSVGGIDVTFVKGEYEQDGKKTHQLRGELEKPGSRRVLITILGPARGFDDEVVRSFLAGIEPIRR